MKYGSFLMNMGQKTLYQCRVPLKFPDAKQRIFEAIQPY